MSIDEHMFYLALTPAKIQLASENEINAAKEFTTKFKTSWDGFQLMIRPGSLEGLTKPISIQFTFLVARYWMKFRPDQISDQDWEVLYDLLFHRATTGPMLRKHDVASMLALADAQSMFTFRMYPKRGADLIREILASQKDITTMRFLSSFCRELAELNPENEEQLHAIRDSLVKDGCCAEIQSRLLTYAQRRGREGLDALAHYAKWGDISWTNDEAFLNAIYGSFLDGAKCKGVVSLWTAILNRVPEDMKRLFVQAAGIDKVIEQALSGAISDAVISSVADIVAFCGFLFMDRPFFDAAVQLVRNQKAKVSITLLSFIDLFVLRHGEGLPEIVTRAIECVLERLAAFFSNPPDGIMAAEECLGDIVCTSYIVNQGVTEGIIGYLIMTEGEIDGDPSKTAAVAFVLGEMMAMGLVPSHFPVYLERMKNLIQMEREITPPLVSTFLNVLRLPIVLPDKSNVDILQFYRVLFPLVMQESEFQTKFARLFVKYLRVYGSILAPAIGGDIDAVFGIQTLEFATIQALIVEQSPLDVKTTLIQHSIQRMREILQQSGDDRDSFAYVLTFFGSLKSTKETYGEIQTLLAQVLERVQGVDDLKAMAIKAIFSLDILGFELFISVAKTVNAEWPRSLGAVADTAKEIRRRARQVPGPAQSEPLVQAILNEKWVAELGMEMCSQLEVIVNECCLLDEDDASRFYPTIISCLSFFVTEIKIITTPGAEEFRRKVHTIISSLMTRHYESPELSEYACIYVYSLTGTTQDSCAEACVLLGHCLHFLYSPEFDPNDSKWNRVLVKLTKVILKIAQQNAEMCQQSFFQIVSQHGGNEQIAGGFLQQLVTCASTQQQRCCAIQFFCELMRLRGLP